MLYVKIMSDEDLADVEPAKNFMLVTVESDETIEFAADPAGAGYVMLVHTENGHSTHKLTGNAYVMNAAGKTIASHSSN